MKVYFFAVSKKDLEIAGSGSKEIFERDLIRNFKNYDFMAGYALGYGFGKIDILSYADLENWHNNKNILQYKFIFAVNVEE